jgi:hypothetical protein
MDNTNILTRQIETYVDWLDSEHERLERERDLYVDANGQDDYVENINSQLEDIEYETDEHLENLDLLIRHISRLLAIITQW